MAAPPALSAVWFPPHQRTTATSISQVFTQLGTGLSFAIGPHMVPEQNMTSIEEVKSYIHSYLWLEAGIVLVIFISICRQAFYPISSLDDITFIIAA